MKSSSHALQLETEQSPWTRAALSLSGGLIFAFCVFYAIALTQLAENDRSPPGFSEAEAVAPPVELPPPPPRTVVETEIPIGTPVQFQEETVADSSVRIQIAPVPVRPLDHSAPLARPGFSARFDLSNSVAAIKPNIDNDVYRVYDRSEVDQRPVIVYRKSPDVSLDLLRKVPVSRVTVLFVVNLNGQVENVRLLKSSNNADFDQLLMEAIADWEFRPAVKNGKTVRCWVQLPVSIRVQSGTSFEAY